MVRPTVVGLAPTVAAMMLLMEAALSVLGIGVQAPAASWGTLIADGQTLIYSRPWAAIAPGVANCRYPQQRATGKRFTITSSIDLPLYPPGLGGKLVVDGRDSPPMERCPLAQVEEGQFELPDVQKSASGVETRASAGSKCRSRGPDWIRRAVRSTIRNSYL